MDILTWDIKEDKFEMIAWERSNTYGLLSLIYSKEPGQEFLANFRSSAFLQLLKKLGFDMEKDFKGKPLEKLVDELAVEYTRLFIGPGEHIYPYESAYCGRESNIKSLIESYGLQYPLDFRSNFDHISIELEFMKKITEEEAKAWERNARETAIECLKLEKRFINEHLGKWVSVFSGRVIKEASLNFYREMAKLTKEYISSEIREIDAWLEGGNYGQNTYY